MLSALQTLPQFIVWKAIQYEGEPKPRKIPMHYQTGELHVSAQDARNWTDFNTATSMVPLIGGTGVGFVLTSADPFCCVDLDACLQADGTWSPFAQQIMEWFPGAAVELSYSGNGLHLWHACDMASIPLNHKTRRADVPGLEIYTTKRFIALGSEVFHGDASTDCTNALLHTLATYLPGTTTEGGDWTDTPVPEWNGPTDDDELIAKIFASKPSAASAFGGRASVKDLWEGNVEVLSGTYPSATGDDFGRSEADAALFAHLAFWTGKDCARMDRLFRRSALVRPKYTEREDYRIDTVTKACAHITDVYSKPTAAQPADATPDQRPEGAVAQMIVREGYQYLTVGQQAEHFKGCVYVQALHRAFTPDGSLLGPEQFKATYGGYEFAMSADGVKPTKSAWEAFTENRAAWFPRAHTLCFRPESAPGALFEESGKTLVNTYVPAVVYRAEGDVAPFLDHVAKLFPDERDRLIIISYMAAMVQHIGVKFQWAPLIQGMEGNGKTFLFHVVAYSVGEHYTHFPSASDIANKFNSWIQGKLFIGLEEIYVSDKREVSEALKPLITNRRIEVHAKGANQITGDNRANFMLSSNHKDAIQKTEGDRRYCVFFTGQQDPGDLERDGMNGSYFPQLYDWARKGGFAAIAHFLQTYQIDNQYNPATACHRAPVTSSTSEAIAVSSGGLEQELEEAIAQGRPGFLGGWISSTALTRLLEELHATRILRQNKRKEMLKNMGYAQHPCLPGGRATALVTQEGNRPTLYVKKDHASCQLKSPADVMIAYMRAQGWDTGEMKAPPASVLGG